MHRSFLPCADQWNQTPWRSRSISHDQAVPMEAPYVWLSSISTELPWAGGASSQAQNQVDRQLLMNKRKTENNLLLGPCQHKRTKLLTVSLYRKNFLMNQKKFAYSLANSLFQYLYVSLSISRLKWEKSRAIYRQIWGRTNTESFYFSELIQL